MVSKAKLDFPDPDSPVKTTNRSRGSSTDTFFRLCSRAPRTEIVGPESTTADLVFRLPAAFFATGFEEVDDERGATFGEANGVPVTERHGVHDVTPQSHLAIGLRTQT